MDRGDARKLVKGFYDARFKGNIDKAMSFLHESVHLEIMGSPDRSKVPFKTAGAGSGRQAVSSLIENFKMDDFKILTLVVDGNNIAFHWRAHVKNHKTGKESTTELMDFWTVKNGKIASIREGCDTALAEWLIT